MWVVFRRGESQGSEPVQGIENENWKRTKFWQEQNQKQNQIL